MTTLPLPILPDPSSKPLRISPTDVSQFVRLEQCERYLRFRLTERSGVTFMGEYDVSPQRVTPLLSLAGRLFEETVEGTSPRDFAASSTPTGPPPRPTGPRTTTR